MKVTSTPAFRCCAEARRREGAISTVAVESSRTIASGRGDQHVADRLDPAETTAHCRGVVLAIAVFLDWQHWARSGSSRKPRSVAVPDNEARPFKQAPAGPGTEQVDRTEASVATK